MFGTIILIGLLTLLVPLLLYALIEDETENPRIVDRRTAEREAKTRAGRRNDDSKVGPRSDRNEDEGWR